MQIQTLNEGFWKTVEKYAQPENVLVFVKPQTSLEIVEDLPTGTDYLKKLHNLVKLITKLE